MFMDGFGVNFFDEVMFGVVVGGLWENCWLNVWLVLWGVGLKMVFYRFGESWCFVNYLNVIMWVVLYMVVLYCLIGVFLFVRLIKRIEFLNREVIEIVFFLIWWLVSFGWVLLSNFWR